MKKQTGENRIINYSIILFVFGLSMVIPIINAYTLSIIVGYGDDVAIMSWGQHHYNIFDLSSKIGTGYRPIRNLWFVIGNAWNQDPFYYYLLNGLLFSGSMVFLYLLGKQLHSKKAGLIAVLLYLLLDASFILVSKLNFIATTGELFFITPALYFSIHFFKNNDKQSMYLAIILSILAFLSKEPSILIIPLVNLTYLWYTKDLKRNRIIMNLLPFIFLFLVYFYISPDVGSGNANLFQRIFDNLEFYIGTEIDSQFKSFVLLAIALIGAGYYYATNKLRTEIGICAMWFIVALLPLLITRQPVQPTYLAESNLGMVLLIGIVISESMKKNNLLLGFIIIGILFQLSVVPTQISAMQNYNHVTSDSEITFLKTVDSLSALPSNTTIFYLPDNLRDKYGGMQLTSDFFKAYLCLRNLCSINVTNSYNDSDYIILPSSLDIYIFNQEMSNKDNIMIITEVKNGNILTAPEIPNGADLQKNDYGFLLRRG